MNQELRIKKLADIAAPIILGTYMFIYIGRLFQPALFTPRLELMTLLVGMSILVGMTITSRKL